KASAEAVGVLAASPDGVDGGHPAILEDSGESSLGSGRGADIQAGIEGRTASRGVLICCAIACVCGCIVAQIVDDGDAGKNIGAEGIDADRSRSEGLGDGAVSLFANKTEDLSDSQIRPDRLRVRDGDALASRGAWLGE